jgi:hypothetical protein
MEYNLLLKFCQENHLVTACKYLMLVDRHEIAKDDMDWKEIEPYVRVLGVRTQDLYQLGPFKSQDLDIIRTSLIQQHQRLCRILKTNSPGLLIKKICDEVKNVKEKTRQVRDKQQKSLEECLKNIKNIQNQILTITDKTNPHTADQSNAFTIQLNNINLKVQTIKEKIKNELYNQETAPALYIIKEELDNTYDEYNNMRNILKERISVYESNPKLAELASKYSQIVMRIQKKKKDIESISS